MKERPNNSSRYLVFATVSMGLLMTGIAGTSIAVGLEAIRTSFNVSLVTVGWVIAIFQLMLTASMPIVGKVSDIVGRKRTFLACLGLYIVGSTLAALSPHIGLLIVSRLIQALGAGGFLPSAVGIVAEAFPHSRQRAIGLFSSIFPIGQIAGPVIGGWLIHSFGWRAIFWVNVPIGLLILLLASLLLPSGGRKEGGIDLVGAGLIAGCLSSLMGAISLVGHAHTPQMWVLIGVLLLASFLLGLVFLRHEGRTRDPIVDVAILKATPFLAANIYNIIYGAGAIGVMSLVPLFAINVYGLSYLQSGIIMVPRAIGMMATSLITSMLLMRVGYRWPIIIGTALAAVSLALLSLEPSQLETLTRGLNSTTSLSLLMLLMGIGVGIAAPASNNACIELMPLRIATITGIRGMSRQAGAAVSITIATITLEQSGTIAAGFHVVFVVLAIAMVATIPAILAMPRSPSGPAE
ncbi:MAG: MFS transporter [Dehalococcoidia bacterium]|nr:MFS transporter [Dehalococcoidia bacterium]